MRIAIASDHAGYTLKEFIIRSFPEHEFLDFGTNNEESIDYPDTGFPAAQAVAEGECEFGILICGSGIGMSITANKVPGIRAALCNITDVARLSRMHNNANVLVLAGRFTATHYAVDIVKTWLETPFDGGRHLNRINKIHQGERK
ncbi:MAG: ribose 5-phosphate isomerase B [Candidatus Cloacimonetes bacterium]|jgi:ribose 5-phosphate isomerase B|nr:ribose 5-phosphate isomerase B [Candidatus Cloacimonadota bacterium]MDD2209724.1 ribose 5-phosphate isomerase B [Candidatus Cloacimonadota bacterium]MDD4231586.1 ribose 5-phosphate isomerase B [Candidatus Cloacimonadota bacterium]MDY0298523.1 ribose 5-phosphate isomerase B [Candidatus Cloacimonadaceae bacterium]